jgi:tRNA(Ile)-lysidine synthase
VQHDLAKLSGIVRSTIRRHRMIESGDRVLVAASGGPDSTGLALVLGELRSRLRCELVVAHVHHGLRGVESDAGERAAAESAAALGVPFVRADAAVEAGGNLEARARGARYRALHELAETNGCNRIATGHTRDDQAETFFLRLLRGAGAEGLAGILPSRPDGVIRPLLDCDRERVAALVRRRGLVWVADSMNEDPRFARTRVRRELLPLLRGLDPGAVGLVARAADSLRAAAEAQQEWLRGALGDGRELETSRLEGLSPDLRLVVVRAWLERQEPELRPSWRLVAGVAALVERVGPGTAVDIAPGRRVVRSGDRLIAAPAVDGEAIDSRRLEIGKPQRLPGGWLLTSELRRGAVELPRDLWSAVLDLDKCGELGVRSSRRGDRIRPLGMDGSKKLAEVFGSRQVPRAARPGYPVIISGDDLLWVPGVARSSTSAVDRSTVRVAILHAERLTVAGRHTP